MSLSMKTLDKEDLGKGATVTKTLERFQTQRHKIKEECEPASEVERLAAGQQRQQWAGQQCAAIMIITWQDENGSMGGLPPLDPPA